MVHRCQVVDERTSTGQSPLFPNGEVGDGLAAERHQSGEAIGVHAVNGQPAAIEGYQAGQITASRVTGEENSVRVPAVSRDVLEGPRHRRCRVFDVRRSFGLGAQSIVHRYRDDPLPLQGRRDGPVAASQTSAVEPDHCRNGRGAHRMVHIEFAAFPGIDVGLGVRTVRQPALGLIDELSGR